jgi:GrpB-like predicted nucleotidyltransferase (UPF0157 family)
MPPELDEPIEIVPYDPRWASLYAADAAEITRVLADRVRAVEHFGSTAVEGLDGKPIIDILVAVAQWPLPDAGRRCFDALGYEYLGEAGVKGRQYFRRRAAHATNLAVVELGGSLWSDNLALRDYLRAHPDAAQRYAQEKRAAWDQGARMLLSYSSSKGAYVADLLAKARQWQRR